MEGQRATMTMWDYLVEIRHAVEGLLPLIWQEQDALSGIERNSPSERMSLPGWGGR